MRRLLLALPLLLCACSLTGVEVHPAIVPADAAARSLTVVSWNAQKAGNAGFHTDLAELLAREQPDLLLLQEGVRELAQSPGHHGFFAPSWHYPWPGGKAVGIVTLSALPALRLAPLNTAAREFEVTAPKTSLISEHALSPDVSLLAANVHLLAFERFGLEDFRRQVEEIAVALADHDGPVLLAGDFNVWSRRRLAILEEAVARLGLVEVAGFPDGRRTGDLGRSWLNALVDVDPALALDRVFVRDLAVRERTVLPYATSDHAPLRVTLTW